jgi:hypothetical protein
MKLLGIISVGSRNRSATDKIFCIRRILKKMRAEYDNTSAGHKLQENL